MHWFSVILAGFLALGFSAGPVSAQDHQAEDSMESLLGGSEGEAAADFPAALEADSDDAEAWGDSPEGSATIGSPGALGDESPLGEAVDNSDIDLEFTADEGLVDLTPDPTNEARVEASLGPVGYDEEGEQGRIHVVVVGDTLWDISASYLGTPWVWPSIWESNPGVANPHRIFPDDQIWITPSKMKRVTPAEAAELLARGPLIPEAPMEDLPPAAVGELVDATPVAPSYQTLEYRAMHGVAYVSEAQYEGAGSIVDSPSFHRLLSETRRAYINLGDGQVSEGDRFSVVRASEVVRDPETGRKLGVLVERLGWLEVTRTRSESSEALIKQSFAEIERGDRILPREEISTEIPIRPAGSGIEGQVAHFQSSRTVMAQRDVVFLNRGTQDGMDIGIPLEIFRDQGRARDAMLGQSVTLPEDIVASLVVVVADPSTSVAVVTSSRTHIERGDTFRTVD